jgi:cytoskeleton protein RodZ
MADSNRDTALGLGERLRSARKARAMTLEQAAFTLRLESSVLRALEDEHYEALGAGVFVRGHLKAYARLLGLSEDVVLAAYRAADPNADAPPKVTRELEKPLTTTPGPLAIAVAVVVVILAMLLLYVLSGGQEPAAPVPETGSAPGRMPTVDTVPVLETQPVLPVDPGPGSPLEPGLQTVPGTVPVTAPVTTGEAAVPPVGTPPAPAPTFE